ncbi:hypothetical protein [Streptomyces sp. NPDC058279]|uniref:hypothetical protein n=1 Tax=Streptomyces sp. NPDC058279 TaxID=3346418 RepID=UPI0036E401AB
MKSLQPIAVRALVAAAAVAGTLVPTVAAVAAVDVVAAGTVPAAVVADGKGIATVTSPEPGFGWG